MVETTLEQLFMAANLRLLRTVDRPHAISWMTVSQMHHELCLLQLVRMKVLPTSPLTKRSVTQKSSELHFVVKTCPFAALHSLHVSICFARMGCSWPALFQQPYLYCCSGPYLSKLGSCLVLLCIAR